MSKPPTFGTIETALTAGGFGSGASEKRDPVFRLAVLGDFTGHSGPAEALTARRPIEVDRDNFEEVLARLAPRLTLPLDGTEGSQVSIAFTDLDHFHPDHLVQTLDVFVQLGDLRRRLLSPAGFAQAAAELGGWAEASRAAEAAEPPEPVEDLLAASLAATGETAGGAAPASGADLAGSLIAKIVGPYVLPAPDPRQDELVASVDSAISHQMRAILHHPAYQALEAAWRGLYFLVRRLETGRSLKLGLINLAAAELEADLMAGEALDAAGLYKLLVESTLATPGGQPWSAVIGLYSFGPEPGEIALLGRIGKIAAAAGAPFLAAAAPGLVGCIAFSAAPDPDDWTQDLSPEAEQAWQALRAEPQAAYLGLVQPRFLLRMPYGNKGEPVESFAFEELAPGTGATHEAYLWGNPAIAAATLIAQGFTAAGWDLRRALPGEIGGLPIHLGEVDGEAQVKPCAEILLSERGGSKIAGRGLMPLWSVRGSDSVQLNPLGALSAEAQALRGPWAG